MEREPIEVYENADQCKKVKNKVKIKCKIVRVTPVVIDNSRKMYENQGRID
jgi:hypothetical protein